MDRLSKKVAKSRKILERAFHKFSRLGVAWSAGKDSTVVLHLTRQIDLDVPVIFGDTFQKFPETYQFCDRISKEWHLNLYIAKPDKDYYRPGVDREYCCHKMKTEPAARMIRDLGLDGYIVGIRWDEHPARSKERYFSLRDDGYKHYRIHPILHWSEKDVHEYIIRNGLPRNPLYDKGYRSIGCKPCTSLPRDTERSGRDQDKEEIMERLRSLGYW